MADSFIRFRCSRCTGALKVKKEGAGKEVYCPACYQKLTVPAESEPDRRSADPAKLYVVDPAPRDVRQMIERFGFLEFRCPVCGTGIAVRQTDVGQKKECPDCGTDSEITAEWFESMERERGERHRQSWNVPPFAPVNSFGDSPVPPPVLSTVYGVRTTEETSEMIDQLGRKVAERENRPKTRSVVVDGQFAVYCPLCGTMQYATIAQIGKKIRCPECERNFVVYKPIELESKVPPPTAVNFEGGTIYGVAETAPPTKTPVASEGNVFVDPASGSRITAPQKTVDVDPNLVSIACSLCGTLMYAPKTMIGQMKKCPDCWTENLIVAPSEEKKITGKNIEPVFSGGYNVTEDAPLSPASSSTLPPIFLGANGKNDASSDSTTYNLSESEPMKSFPVSPIRRVPSASKRKRGESATLDALKNLEEAFQNGTIESLPPDPALNAELPAIDARRKFKSPKSQKGEGKRKKRAPTGRRSPAIRQVLFQRLSMAGWFWFRRLHRPIR